MLTHQVRQSAAQLAMTPPPGLGQLGRCHGNNTSAHAALGSFDCRVWFACSELPFTTLLIMLLPHPFPAADQKMGA